ncbi:hypothetical protein K1T71_006258 [Dendrolimus kikuchii]|uniref:Uncharacterized protein n=1 Tax=Dendrolimus kikuchii TaxID=765133 RepID=A0ACC1D3P0_9NEOP|nr:hypothetical protein K1T71_006258 [Dendrolimus kikuchii]
MHRNVAIIYRSSKRIIENDVIKRFPEIQSDVELPKEQLKTEEEIITDAVCLKVTSLKGLVSDEEEEHKLAAVNNSLYMDELLMRCQNVAKGVNTYQGSKSLSNKAGYEMQKWTINNNDLLQEIINKRVKYAVKEEMTMKIDEKLMIVYNMKTRVTLDDYRKFYCINSLRCLQHVKSLVYLIPIWFHRSNEYMLRFFHRYKWLLFSSRWLYGKIIATHTGLEFVIID